uniref:Uncharacterized protein n=1 Tax=Cafeteria roenbergensis TaxID=33653 RepID=A0A7S0K8Q6_CAFRO
MHRPASALDVSARGGSAALRSCGTRAGALRAVEVWRKTAGRATSPGGTGSARSGLHGSGGRTSGKPCSRADGLGSAWDTCTDAAAPSALSHGSDAPAGSHAARAVSEASSSSLDEDEAPAALPGRPSHACPRRLTPGRAGHAAATAAPDATAASALAVSVAVAGVPQALARPGGGASRTGAPRDGPAVSRAQGLPLAPAQPQLTRPPSLSGTSAPVPRLPLSRALPGSRDVRAHDPAAAAPWAASAPSPRPCGTLRRA